MDDSKKVGKNMDNFNMETKVYVKSFKLFHQKTTSHFLGIFKQTWPLRPLGFRPKFFHGLLFPTLHSGIQACNAFRTLEVIP